MAGIPGFSGQRPFNPKMPRPTRPRKNPFKNPLFVTVLILGALVGIIYAASQIWTEVLWYNQMESARVLWTRWGTAGALGLAGFIFQYAVVMAVVYWAYSKRPNKKPDPASPLAGYQKELEPFRKVIFFGLPGVIALMTSIGLAANWQPVLLWLNRTPFGEVDPQFGIDLSFYIFTLPVLNLLVGYLFNTLVLALVAAIVVNYFFGALVITPKFSSTSAARKQVALLAAVLSLVVAGRYWLSIYTLLNKKGELADGALYKEVHAMIPAQTILAVISVLVAGLFVVAALRGTWRLPAVGVAVTVLSALVIGGAYPALVQQFKVTPNARQLEQPYIQRNIDATLDAYGLDDVEYQTYAAKTEATSGQLREDTESTSQIRLLDPTIISPTVRQLQQSRPYYTFDQQLSVDRYTVEDERRDTVIAVRDIYLPGLQEQQQTWVNEHTVYTHGFGVVAAYGNTVRSDGTPAFWEQSIPSTGELGEYEPRVYFSANSPSYSIVGAPEGAEPQELDYPDDNAESGQVQTTYKGDGGPSVGSWWPKLLYAIKFGSTDIFFSSQTNSESQILYDRDPLLRVAKVAPYLTLEHRAYPAVVDMDDDPDTPKRLVWIVDGYTTSNDYPYSEHQSVAEATADSRAETAQQVVNLDEINYMRNSVKAVVDAYDGSVTLYAWDPEDPILQSWRSVYPGMVDDVEDISGDLMAHLRYPEDMFKVQRKLLETYHVTEAGKFYTGGDRWRLSEDPASAAGPETSSGTNQPLQPPYYLTMQMPGQDSAEFSLTSVYVPAGGGESRRAAMAGFLAVDSETGSEPGQVREDYGKLRLIALPSSTTVPGPGQVQNNFNTDQKVAIELNLLSQQGSNVRRGNLLTLPVGGGLLYVQPVYVESTSSTSYPVLRYVLTSFGDQVGFGKTLNEALDQTFGGDAQATTGETNKKKDSDKGKGGSGKELTREELLNEAITAAGEAMQASQKAMEDGDWAAYGEAQDDLQSALEDLVQLQGLEQSSGESKAKSGTKGGGASTEAPNDLGDVDLGELGEDAKQATETE